MGWPPEVTCGLGSGRSCCAGGLESRGRSREEERASGEEAVLLRTVANRSRRHCSEFDDPLPKEAGFSVEAFQGKPFKNISPTSLCVSLSSFLDVYVFIYFFFPALGALPLNLQLARPRVEVRA